MNAHRKDDVQVIEPSTALAVVTPEERASQALGFVVLQAKLAELALASQAITEITNGAGREECHAARMLLKNTRVEIQKRGKEAREDATKFSKAVIAKEKDLIEIIEPEETRLDGIQKTWDDARAAEKAEQARLEAERLAEIKGRITAIANMPFALMTASVEDLDAAIVIVEAFDTSEFAGQQQMEASDTQAAVAQRLVEMRAARVESDANKERLDEERAELQRQRDALEATQREAKARQDALDAEAATERKRLADIETERVRVETEARRKQEDEARAERERKEEAERAERQTRLDAEDAERAARQAAEDTEREAEAKRLRDSQAELDAKLAREREEATQALAEQVKATKDAAIKAATLHSAAQAAHDLLVELGEGEHLTTETLGAVLARNHKEPA